MEYQVGEVASQEILDLPLLRRAERTVAEPWGYEDLKKKVAEHDALQQKIDGLEAALATYASLERAKIKELDKDRKLMSHELTKGQFVDTWCEIRVDAENNRRVVIRSDTFEIISIESLSSDDSQMTLDEIERATTAAAEQAPGVPLSRTSRTKDEIARVGRWASEVYWGAHDAGLLDPTEDDLTRALADIGDAGLPELELLEVVTELDTIEQDCIAEIEMSAKARKALKAGTFPTEQPKVDAAIGEVRWQRARLDVGRRGDHTDGFETAAGA